MEFTLALVVAVAAGNCSRQQQQPARPSADRKEVSATTGAPTETTSKTILSAPLDAFPQLPDAIRSTLRSRECTIPQPGTTGAPRNVIHGDFFVQGQTGWAVLCAFGGFSSILVFRDDFDVDPEELARGEDKNYGASVFGYLREITPVDRQFIMRHYEAYGGPKPPPIDHQGIDDAFLEKASVTYYWYEGKWLQLQGAD